MKKVLAIIMVIILALGVVGCADKDENISRDISEISIDKPVDVTKSSGVGIELAYESEDKIIFYGDFGLFEYDLNESEITLAVDFVKAVGIEGSVQGSYGTAVEVSDDGKTVIVSEYDVEGDARGAVCTIDTEALTYTKGEYIPLDDAFMKDNTKGYIYPGTKIGDAKYILGNKEWILFEKVYK